MARLRRASLTAFGLTLATPLVAHAEHCRPASIDSVTPRIGADFRAEAATYRTSRFEGSYEGVFLQGSMQYSGLGLRVEQPGYRIVRNGRPEQGFGDLFGEVQLRFYGLPRPSQRVGLAFAMSAPTGSAEKDLGMGHFMAMPSLWADLTASRFLLQAKLSYAKALGSGPTHGAHAHGASPIVAPMNASELGALLSVSTRLYDVVWARLGTITGIALNPGGASRSTARFGTDFVFERLRFAVEAELPLLGDPFLVKLASEAGVRF